MIFFFAGNHADPWLGRSVPRSIDDRGPGDAQLLLLLRRVRSGPGGSETGRHDPSRLRADGHDRGWGRGRHTPVDGHVPGGRGQVPHTAGRRATDPWLGHGHVAGVQERGHGGLVQRPVADARPVRALVRGAVHRLRVHQTDVRTVKPMTAGGDDDDNAVNAGTENRSRDAGGTGATLRR